MCVRPVNVYSFVFLRNEAARSASKKICLNVWITFFSLLVLNVLCVSALDMETPTNRPVKMFCVLTAGCFDFSCNVGKK